MIYLIVNCFKLLIMLLVFNRCIIVKYFKNYETNKQKLSKNLFAISDSINYYFFFFRSIKVIERQFQQTILPQNQISSLFDHNFFELLGKNVFYLKEIF